MTYTAFTALLIAQTQTIPVATAPLSEQQSAKAIEMRRDGNVPIVQVGTFLGMSKGDFNVVHRGLRDPKL